MCRTMSIAIPLMSFGMYAPSAHAVLCNGSEQPFCEFINDPFGFMSVAGELRDIDFETLPDGSPSFGGTPITPAFNYTEQGVTFSVPAGDLIIGGFSADHDLRVDTFDAATPTWIIADLVVPTSAVGIYFPGGTTLLAFDNVGNLITSASFDFFGENLFLGIVSETPIARAIVNRGANFESINSFLFNPVPEPASLALMFLGGGLITHRHRRR